MTDDPGTSLRGVERKPVILYFLLGQLLVVIATALQQDFTAVQWTVFTALIATLNTVLYIASHVLEDRLNAPTDAAQQD